MRDLGSRMRVINRSRPQCSLRRRTPQITFRVVQCTSNYFELQSVLYNIRKTLSRPIQFICIENGPRHFAELSNIHKRSKYLKYLCQIFKHSNIYIPFLDLKYVSILNRKKTFLQKPSFIYTYIQTLPDNGRLSTYINRPAYINSWAYTYSAALVLRPAYVIRPAYAQRA